MPCTPVLCKTCKYQNTETEQNCDLMDQWVIFGSDPNEDCEAYVPINVQDSTTESEK